MNKPHVLCAVSGGADSVAMLRLLHGRGDLLLTVAHVDHSIRGEASREDAAFVAALCAELGVPLRMVALDVPALAAQWGMGLEQAAREARHRFLRETMADVGAESIALAHHMGDQAETLLMHMARGAGLSGARCMAEREGIYWRPLLRWDRQQIEAYLLSLGQPHREDTTNAVLDNPRNLIRHEVLPALTRAYPRAESALNRFCHITAEEDALLAQLTDAFLAEHAQSLPHGHRLRLGADVHGALLRRALRQLTGAQDFDTIERLREIYNGGGALRQGFSGGLTAHRGGVHLYLLRGSAPAPVPVPIADGAQLPGIGTLLLAEGPPTTADLGPYRQALHPAALEGAVLRCRRDGDRFRMLGARGSRKLSDVFTDRKIDRPLRDVWPLIAAGGQILWIPCVGVSHEARITEDLGRALIAEFRPSFATTPQISQ